MKIGYFAQSQWTISHKNILTSPTVFNHTDLYYAAQILEEGAGYNNGNR